MPRPAIFRNLGTKLLSLAIAILVWFVFSAQQRERISERSYRIPLSVANVPPATLIASPLPPTIEVRVRGPFTALRQLDPVKLEAVVDLTGASRGEKIYRLAPEDVNVPQEVEVIAIAPSEIRIALDTTAEKSLPIVARVTGKPAEGYEVSEVVVEPRVARLLGPASAVAPMTSVETDPISLANRSATFSVPATVIADAPGVRVREGQVVTVTVGVRPVPGPEPTPTPVRRGVKR
jgi:YbbR domain-containing protein